MKRRVNSNVECGSVLIQPLRAKYLPVLVAIWKQNTTRISHVCNLLRSAVADCYRHHFETRGMIVGKSFGVTRDSRLAGFNAVRCPVSHFEAASSLAGDGGCLAAPSVSGHWGKTGPSPHGALRLRHQHFERMVRPLRLLSRFGVSLTGSRIGFPAREGASRRFHAQKICHRRERIPAIFKGIHYELLVSAAIALL